MSFKKDSDEEIWTWLEDDFHVSDNCHPTFNLACRNESGDYGGVAVAEMQCNASPEELSFQVIDSSGGLAEIQVTSLTAPYCQ